MHRAERSSAPMPYSRRERSFRDGLGERVSDADSAAAHVERLVVSHELAGVRSFEHALRDRVSRLASFRHPSFAGVRGVESLAGGTGIVLASDYVPAVRLSTVLEAAHAGALAVNLSAALDLIRQLVWAVAALHETGREVAHGALAPERLLLARGGRLIVTEYVFGPALEALLWPPVKYWADLRVPLPRTSYLARFDQGTDVTQIGVVALALILGRPVRTEEYPSRISELIHGAQAIVPGKPAEPLHSALRLWVERAIADSRQSFPSGTEAGVALETAIAESGDEMRADALEQLLVQYESLDPVSAPPATVILEPTVTTADASDPEQLTLITPPRPPEDFQDQIVEWSPAPLPSPEATSRRWMPIAAGIGGIAVIGTILTVALPRRDAEAAKPAPSTGTLAVTTEPPGASAVVDGTSQGTTPLTLTLEAGVHRLELRGPGGVRTIPVTIKAGERASQFVDLPLPLPATEAGQLRVSTDPPGTEILVDGAPRGVSPLVIRGLAPGDHTIMARSGNFGSAKQRITLEPNVTASVLLTLAKSDSAASGWVAVTTPFPVQIFESGSLIGSSESDRVMVAVGRHEFELKNDQLGYRAAQEVTVAAGKLSTLMVEPPQGRLALNAQPWAEVWVDGAKVGETPIGNLSLPIGTHEIVFRHPELGEQKHTALVTLTGPARISAIFKK